jgi:thiosulfate/3-mercaptopyruvate sulfurtransferase
MGIDGKTDVVVYGSALPETARIWWLLKYCGVPSASVLDGGFPAWVAAGGPVEQVAAAPQPVGFSATFQPDRLIEIDELLLGDGEWLVIDNRSADEFTGRVARGARGGHIPGACSLDWVGFVDENGLLKPREQLRAMLAERGFGEKRTAITHCQTGGRSSVGALVVEWVTGEPARNYYRSWSEYAAHPTAPVEK